MNTRTAGVISLIAFLTALVAVVWLLVAVDNKKIEVVRIDSVPQRTVPLTPAYTEGGARSAKATREVEDADE